MQPLGESWDVVEVVRSLVTEVDSLQRIVARQEARCRCGPRPVTPHLWLRRQVQAQVSPLVTWSRNLRHKQCPGAVKRRR